jgi:hypothetical protein
MYALFGWINVALVALMLLPVAMQNMNQMIFKKEEGLYVKTAKFFRKIHRYIGAVLLVFILVHGYLALGSLRLHTGTVLGALFLAAALFAGIFILGKKKWAFKTHKAFAIAFTTFLLVHLLVPSALYYLFGV